MRKLNDAAKTGPVVCLYCNQQLHPGSSLLHMQQICSKSSPMPRKAAGYTGSHGYWGAPKVLAFFELTYIAGLRKAGLPEE
jgi:hypothetical protein